MARVNCLKTIDVSVALGFRHAILFHKPPLAGLDRVATSRAGDCFWLPEEHVDLQAQYIALFALPRWR
jgi:hypothetical protein